MLHRALVHMVVTQITWHITWHDTWYFVIYLLSWWKDTKLKTPALVKLCPSCRIFTASQNNWGRVSNIWSSPARNQSSIMSQKVPCSHSNQTLCVADQTLITDYITVLTFFREFWRVCRALHWHFASIPRHYYHFTVVVLWSGCLLLFWLV